MFTSNEDNRLNSNTFNGWASVASICAHISRVFRNFPVCCTIPLNWFYVGYIVCSQLISTFTKVQYLISIILYYYFHLFSLIQEWIFFYLAVMLFFFWTYSIHWDSWLCPTRLFLVGTFCWVKIGLFSGLFQEIVAKKRIPSWNFTKHHLFFIFLHPVREIFENWVWAEFRMQCS